MSLDQQCGCCPGDPGHGGGGGQGRPPKVAGARVWKTGFPGFNPLLGARTATAVNYPLTGLGNINGMPQPLEEGDYVLVNAQTDRTTNGVYAASAGAWTKVIAGYDNLIIHVWEGSQAGWYVSSVVGSDIIIQLTSGVSYGRVFGREIFGSAEYTPVDPSAVQAPWQRNGTVTSPTALTFLDAYGFLKTTVMTHGSVSGTFNASFSRRATIDGAGPLSNLGWTFIAADLNGDWIRRTDTPAVVHPRIVPAGGFAKSEGAYYCALTERNLLADFDNPSADPANWALADVARRVPVRIETVPPFARYRRWRETNTVTCPDGTVVTSTREWLHDWQGAPRYTTLTELVDYSALGELTAPPAPPALADIPGALSIINVNLATPDESDFEFPNGGGNPFILIEETAGGTSWTAHFVLHRDWYYVIGGPNDGQYYTDYTCTQRIEVSEPITDDEVMQKLNALLPATLADKPWGFYQFRGYWSDGTIRDFVGASFSTAFVDGVADSTNGFYNFTDSYVEDGIAQLDV